MNGLKHAGAFTLGAGVVALAIVLMGDTNDAPTTPTLIYTPDETVPVGGTVECWEEMECWDWRNMGNGVAGGALYVGGETIEVLVTDNRDGTYTLVEVDR